MVQSTIFKRLKTKSFWLNILRDSAIILLILGAYSSFQTRNMPDQAPPLVAQLLSKDSVNLNHMLKESPVLIYFWGSWCPLCSYTSSTVTELSKEYPVITIALSSGDPKEVQQYLDKNHYDFPVINDPDGVISQQWSVFATPTFFIVNRNGEISSVSTGVSSEWGLKLKLWWAS